MVAAIVGVVSFAFQWSGVIVAIILTIRALFSLIEHHRNKKRQARYLTLYECYWFHTTPYAWLQYQQDARLLIPWWKRVWIRWNKYCRGY